MERTAEIEIVRQIAQGEPPYGAATLAGCYNVERLLRLQERTGDYRKRLPRVWERTIDHEAHIAAASGASFDIDAAVASYIVRVIELAAQNLEVSAADMEEWQTHILDTLLSLPPAS